MHFCFLFTYIQLFIIVFYIYLMLIFNLFVIIIPNLIKYHPNIDTTFIIFYYTLVYLHLLVISIYQK